MEVEWKLKVESSVCVVVAVYFSLVFIYLLFATKLKRRLNSFSHGVTTDFEFVRTRAVAVSVLRP